MGLTNYAIGQVSHALGSFGKEQSTSTPLPGTVHRATPQITERPVDVVTDRNNQPLKGWQGDTRVDKITATQDNQNEFTLHLSIYTQLLKSGTDPARTLAIERQNQRDLVSFYYGNALQSTAAFAALSYGRSGLESAVQNAMYNEGMRLKAVEWGTGYHNLDHSTNPNGE